MTTNETIAYLKQVIEMEQQLMQLRVVKEELELHRLAYTNKTYYKMHKTYKKPSDLVEWLDKPFFLNTGTVYLGVSTSYIRNQYPNLYAVKGEKAGAPTGLKEQEKFFLDNYQKPKIDKNIIASLKQEPTLPAAITSPKRNHIKRSRVWIVGCSLILLVWLILIMTYVNYNVDLTSLFDLAESWSIYTLSLMILCFCWFKDRFNRANNREYEIYKHHLDQYLKQKQEYDNAVEQREQAIKTVMACMEQAYTLAADKADKAYCAFAEQRHQKLTKEVVQIGSLIKDAEQTLQKLYNQNVIHAKYRNLTACCMFLEYLESGRCDALVGANGAYNLYESELRQNLIIYKLDEVVQRLDTLQSTMYRCCQAIETVSRKLDVVHSDLQKLNTKAQKQLELSSLTAVYAAATAANTSAIKYLTLIN